MKKVLLIIMSIFMICCFVFIATQVSAGPSGMVYDVWVSQSFGGPPYVPFHDCARFDDGTMWLDGCGDKGPMIENLIKPGLSVWRGRVPCGGLLLTFTGHALDGSQANVIGAIGEGRAQDTQFGLEGVMNMDCIMDAVQGENPYSSE